MKRLLSALTLIAGTCLVGVALTAPAVAGCTTIIDDLGESTQVCQYTDKELTEIRNQEQSSVWAVFQICKDGTSGGAEVCSNPRVCTLGGTIGTWYSVTRDGVFVGEACLTDTESTKHKRVSIRSLVIKQFERLSWPASPLVVQPPGGKTLVNLETVFYTTNVGFTEVPINLLGFEIRVKAEPIKYAWRFGDGATSTTTTPGAPYPDFDVFHVYESVDKVDVSVDTTYGNASFSVDGGAWQDIDSTLLVSGAAVELEVLEAKPQLVR